MCRELESENANLQEEYQHLKASSNNSSVSGGSTTTGSGATGSSNMHQQQQQLTAKPFSASGVPASDAEILQEAKMLREHKGRLETRMKILEDHNSQLESQLGKLKMMLHDVSVKPNSQQWRRNGLVMVI